MDTEAQHTISRLCRNHEAHHGYPCTDVDLFRRGFSTPTGLALLIALVLMASFAVSVVFDCIQTTIKPLLYPGEHLDQHVIVDAPHQDQIDIDRQIATEMQQTVDEKPKDQPLSLMGVIRSIEQDLKCAICHDVFYRPIALKCSHRYCWGCWAQHSRTSSKRMQVFNVDTRSTKTVCNVKCPLCMQDNFLKGMTGRNATPEGSFMDGVLGSIATSVKQLCSE